jgi:hypothetical protein
MEVKAEFRGKLKYLVEIGEEAWQDHPEVVAAVAAVIELMLKGSNEMVLQDGRYSPV